jgi:hypothetical protein
MNLYTVVVLVSNRYWGDRLLKLHPDDLRAILLSATDEEAHMQVKEGRMNSQRRFLRYMTGTRKTRHFAVYSFILSLPLLMTALAAKQFDRLPTNVSAPSAGILFIGVVSIGSIVLDFVKRQHIEFNGFIKESDW